MELAKETKPEAPTINLKGFSKSYEVMIQYMCGMRGWYGVPLIYVARPASDLTPIAEADDPSNTYATYDEETVKRRRYKLLHMSKSDTL